jgi:hypothetical protein
LVLVGQLLLPLEQEELRGQILYFLLSLLSVEATGGITETMVVTLRAGVGTTQVLERPLRHRRQVRDLPGETEQERILGLAGAEQGQWG